MASWRGRQQHQRRIVRVRLWSLSDPAVGQPLIGRDQPDPQAAPLAHPYPGRERDVRVAAERQVFGGGQGRLRGGPARASDPSSVAPPPSIRLRARPSRPTSRPRASVSHLQTSRARERAFRPPPAHRDGAGRVSPALPHRLFAAGRTHPIELVLDRSAPAPAVSQQDAGWVG